ncbi:MAG: hypothetical protein ACQERB_10650 [Promethearchaeati archaeon]
MGPFSGKDILLRCFRCRKLFRTLKATNWDDFKRIAEKEGGEIFQ